jgi:putative FmdB family regulatory protein
MPLYDFICKACGLEQTRLCKASDDPLCSCGSPLHRLPSLFSIAIAGNVGPKLGNRVALSDELDKQGFSAPLFRNEESKDKARWAIKRKRLP